MIATTSVETTLALLDDASKNRATRSRTRVGSRRRYALGGRQGRIVGQPCSLRDLSAQGASVRLNGLLLLPIDFAVSFDGFRTIVDCRLIWRDGDFAGLTFRR
jgi:hypothetical protein